MKVLESFKKLMTYTQSAVSSNYSEKGINSILDLVGSGKDLILIEELYNVALKTLQEYRNEVFFLKIFLIIIK